LSQPRAAIGDGEQPRAVGADVNAGKSAEARVGRAQRDAAAIFELAGLALGRIARIERHGLREQRDRLLRRCARGKCREEDDRCDAA
jgi:hypothetical protein